MSMRGTCRTEISETEELVQALKNLYGEKFITQSGEDVFVDIPKAYAKPVFKIVNGKYELIYDTMDRYALRDLIPQKQPNGTIVHRLAQEYSRIKVGKALKTIKGVAVSESTDKDGNISIKVRVKE